MVFFLIAALVLLSNAVCAWQNAGLSIGDFETQSLTNGLVVKRQEAEEMDLQALYPEHNISIPIDHFYNISRYEPHSDGFFPNRYWFDASHYKEGGPIIVLASGETSGVGRLGFLQKGMIAQLAESTNGIAVVLEHRYYGTSIPVPDFSTENLRWLTHEQAMADTAYFAKNIKFPGLEHLDLTAPKNPWILYGGSYAGAFVAFLRVVYPDLFWGAISSSGVTKSIYDYWEYYDTLRPYVEPNCLASTQQLTGVVDSVLLKNDSDSVVQLKETFFLPNVTNNADFANVLSYGIGQWQGLNWDPAISGTELYSYCGNVSSDTLLYPETESLRSTAQEIITRSGFEASNLTTRMLNYIGYLKLKRVDSCTDSQDSCFSNLNTTFYKQDDLSRDWRLWSYQYCDQWGYLQTGAGVPQDRLPLISRLIDIPYSMVVCNEAFGIYREADTNAINKWGGFDIEYSRLAFIDGEADPWKAATPHADGQRQRRDTIDKPFVLIGGKAVHHWDENGLFKNETTDELPPKPVKKAQKYEREFVQAWLKQWKREQHGCGGH